MGSDGPACNVCAAAASAGCAGMWACRCSGLLAPLMITPAVASSSRSSSSSGIQNQSEMSSLVPGAPVRPIATGKARRIRRADPPASLSC